MLSIINPMYLKNQMIVNEEEMIVNEEEIIVNEEEIIVNEEEMMVNEEEMMVKEEEMMVKEEEMMVKEEEIIVKEEEIIVNEEEMFVPGEFLYITDLNVRAMLQNGWKTINHLELWEYMKNPTDSYMFSSDLEISHIMSQMETFGYNYHSGCSFGWTMRQLQYIAQYGEVSFMYNNLK